jgi:hypothetical protein
MPVDINHFNDILGQIGGGLELWQGLFQQVIHTLASFWKPVFFFCLS